jgi:(p)ppGpp synthase/HD superfamily hydrolase
MNMAQEFALAVHGDQMYSDEPFGVHLQNVVDVLKRFGIDRWPILDAAWLHDTLEDTETTYEQIRDAFGAQVADLVLAVTDEPGANRKERAVKTWMKIRSFGHDAVALKLADRIANTEYSMTHKSHHLKMYKQEFPAFSTALFEPGEHEDMWDYLRRITTGAAYRPIEHFKGR